MDDWWMDFNMISAAIANSAIISGKELLIPVSDNIIPDTKGITIRSSGALASIACVKEMFCGYKLLCQLSLFQIS